MYNSVEYEELIIHNCDRWQNWFWARFTVNILYIVLLGGVTRQQQGGMTAYTALTTAQRFQ